MTENDPEAIRLRRSIADTQRIARRHSRDNSTEVHDAALMMLRSLYAICKRKGIPCDD
jgi:hypothetical protein